VQLLRRLVNFYRLQFELIWHWRPGRTQLLRRAAVSFGVAMVSLAATAVLLPGLRIDTPLALALAVIIIGVLSALVRPLLLAIVAPVSPVLVLIGALFFQVAVLMSLAPIVPGFHISGLVDAFIASWVFAVANSLLTWLLSLDSDESYYAMLMRRLIASQPDAIRSDRPGLVVIQVDGLAHAVLEQQLRAGRVPVIARWLRSGRMRLTRWSTLLPSQTSASQAGILFGWNDDIPAFRWWDKSTGRLFVSNRVADAESLESRLGARPGLLASDGASVGNLLSGGAARSYLTLSTLRDRAQGLGRSQSYLSFFLSPYAYAHAIVLGLAEVGKELFQSRRARSAGLEPRLGREFPYPLVRALINVVVRPVSTSLVIEEMLRGTPLIYVTYADYDEIAHYSGPEREESLAALDGVDRAIGSLLRATADAPRPYEFVVLSDHGQTLGATFRQRYGRSLEEVIRELMGSDGVINAATVEPAEWRVVSTFLSEVEQAPGAAGAVAARLLRGRTRGGQVVVSRTPARSDESGAGAIAAGRPAVAVCPSGNLAHIYFPRLAGRVSLETLDQLHPGLVAALAGHPGIGLLMVRSVDGGAVVAGRAGLRYLTDGRVDGEDPLLPFGSQAEAALKRLDSMANCGDLVVISMFDSQTGEVAAFEELIGSHGGMGGAQTDPLLLYPSAWPPADEPLIGAPAVHDQLRRWLDGLAAEQR
jgi:uncharacterized membrane protein YvlD (DUF360 family)